MRALSVLLSFTRQTARNESPLSLEQPIEWANKADADSIFTRAIVPSDNEVPFSRSVKKTDKEQRQTERMERIFLSVKRMPPGLNRVNNNMK